MATKERRTRLLLPVAVARFARARVDLAGRPREPVRWPKPAWAAVIAIGFIGPISCVQFGRIGARHRSMTAAGQGELEVL